MAPLRGFEGAETGRSDRAQLLLLGAFMLAAIFLTLAIVLNSAIFAGNLATRGDVPDSAHAMDYRYEVEQGTGAVIEYANRHNHSNTGELETAVEESLENITLQGGMQMAGDGRIVSLHEDIDFTHGERVVQTDSDRNFTDGNFDEGEWTIAENVKNVRAFRMNLSVNSIDTDGPLNVTTNSTFSGEGYWAMEIREGADPDEIDVTVKVDGHEEEITVEDTSDWLELDITGGKVAGEPSHVFTRGEDGQSMWIADEIDDDEFDIEVNDGWDVEGTYEFVIDEGDIDTSISSDPDQDLYYTEAIYSVTLEGFRYDTPSLTYETDIQVAPDEPGERYSDD